jgi:hypothetical protein
VQFVRKKTGVDLRWLRAWFDLAPDERKFVAGILAIALVGMVARYVHLRNEKPETCRPEGAEQVGREERP